MNIKRIFLIMIIICIFIGALVFNYYLLKTYNVTLEYPLSNKTIVIDPGHGGIDPGKVGLYGEDEKYINLKIAMKLKKLLKSAGAKVILTRKDNEGLYIDNVSDSIWYKNEDMIKRRRIIRDSKGDVVISIHMNSYPDTTVFGPQAFYYEESSNGEKLAKLVQEELIDVSFKPNKREAKGNSNYIILKGNKIPSLVVECGFLSNLQEEQMLNKDKYQQNIAWAIMKGIVRYFYETGK